jgi:CheY-like chemotaxis protein
MMRDQNPSCTALVVEEDAEGRSLLTALLEESEFSIVECESGEAALAAMPLRENDVALIFADQRLAVSWMVLILRAK